MNHYFYSMLVLLIYVCMAMDQSPATQPVMKIALVGDSTVAPQQGWGPGFTARLAPGVVCFNDALNGRSSKSFRDEGHWEPMLAQKPDYVLIQFGHNDQPGKGPTRETDPATTFRDNLRRYVREARDAGIKPILVTSLTRRKFADGKVKMDLKDYIEATIAVAKEMDVPLIDLNARSAALCNQLGPEACHDFEPKSADGSFDATHLNSRGSTVFGSVVADELAVVVPELKPLIIPAPTSRP